MSFTKSMKLQHFILVMGLIFLSIFIVYIFQNSHKTPAQSSPAPQNINLPTIYLNNIGIYVELADTPQKQAKGLSGRTELKDGYGMLFPYTPPQMASFWMKDMLIPIDIIFIKDNKVTTLYENVQPEPDIPLAKLKRYSSKQAIDFVLEVPAGWSQKNGVKVGSEFIYEPKQYQN